MSTTQYFKTLKAKNIKSARIWFNWRNVNMNWILDYMELFSFM